MKKSKLVLASLLALSGVAGLVSCNGQGGSKEETPTSTEPAHVHTYTKVEAKAATCDEDGNIEYYTCECGKYFNTDYQEIEWRDTVIDAHHTMSKHDEVVGLLAGSDEYYECTECGHFFSDEEGTLEIQENSWVNEGYAIRYKAGETMSTKEVKAVSLADLEGKALAFDFKMTEDGDNFLCLGQTTANTYNVSGAFHIIKDGTKWRTTLGTVTEYAGEDEAKAGFMTLTINRPEFTGDGMALHGADGIDVIFGGWVGETAKADKDIIIDPQSFRVVEDNGIRGAHIFAGDEINSHIGTEIPLTDLEGKAIAMDFKFVTDGEFHFILCASNWSNMSGDIKVKKSGDTYTSNMGVIVDSEVNAGYKTLFLNYSAFYGDNTQNGQNVYVIYSGAANQTAEVYFDYANARVVNEVRRPQAGDDDIHNMGFKITKEELQGKALSFDVKMPATGKLKIGFVKDTSWAAFIADIFVEVAGSAGSLAVRQAATPLNAKVGEADANGYRNIVINADQLTFGNGVALTQWVVTWAESAQGAYVDLASVKAVDAITDGKALMLEYGDIVPMKEVQAADLAGKALTFNVYFGVEEDAQVKFSLYTDGWSSYYAADFFVRQNSGVVTVTQGSMKLHYTVSAKVAGWVTVTIYEQSLTKGAGAKFNRMMLWNGKDTTDGCGLDLASFAVAETLERGTYFEKGKDINMSLGKKLDKSAFVNKAIAIDLKLVEDGSITFTLQSSDWKNMSGNLIITKSGDTYSCTGKGGLDAGKFSAPDANGYVTLTINNGALNGDGYEVGNDFAIIYGGKGGINASSYIDLYTVRAVEPVRLGTFFAAGAAINTTFMHSTPTSLLNGKAIAFDVKLVNDGSISITFCSLIEDWANASGAFQIAKSGDTYTCKQGENTFGTCSTPDADGYVTVTINYGIFGGDGFNKAHDVTIIYGGAGGIGVDSYIDLSSAKVVDHVRTETLFAAGSSIDKATPHKLLKGELEGKALAFDLKMTGDGTSKFAILAYQHWENMSSKINITKSGETYSAVLPFSQNKAIGVFSEADANGYVTLTINFEDFAGDGLENGPDVGRIYNGDADAVGVDTYIDLTSFRVVAKVA